MKTKLLAEKDIEAAAAILRAGGLVGIPTETVYGLGANGLDETAVAKIFVAKGRPQDNPLILHILDGSWLQRYCRDIPSVAYTLAERFWPGPLTMILPRRENVPNVVAAGLDTVGVRCPNHPVTLAVIRAADVPVAAPSGNISGRPSPTCAAHMWEDMAGKIDGILDGGPCDVGVESTIVDLTCTPPRLLRPGGLALEMLREILGEIVLDPALLRPMRQGEQPRAPGMKYRHYAPKAPVMVVTGNPTATAKYIAAHVTEKSGVICFDEYVDCFPHTLTRVVGSVHDSEAQARRVFDALRAFDETEVTEIYTQCPGEAGLGMAVANRLKKAAGFCVIEVTE